MAQDPDPPRLSVGILLPQEEGPGDPPPTWELLSAAARTAEDVGLDSVWLVDHFLWDTDPWGRDPADYGVETDPRGYGCREAWTTIAGLAAVTSRVRLGTLVTCTRYRNPALLAKMADTVDEISGGRLILGLGAGWHEPEYRSFGYPFDHRVGRFEEALTIIHGLLRNGHIDFAGTYYSARDCELRPRGPRKAGSPIWIGAYNQRMLQLTARYADAWNAWGRNNAEEIPADRASVDAACAVVGRDPATLARTVAVLVDLPGKAGRPRETKPALAGTPEELVTAFRAYAREGISHVQVYIEPNTQAGIERFAPVLEALG